jgi:thiamine-phosphate diphosphorylase
MFELYLITPALAPDRLLHQTLRALEGAEPGRVALQLRTKHLSLAQTRELAMTLRAATRHAGVALIINQHVEIAVECAADGVQLPELGPTVRQAHAILGARWVGRSCHDAAGLTRAAADGADLATLAPVFAVSGKGMPLGVASLETLVRATQIPVYALGGITCTSIPAVLAAGVTGVAVIREVFEAADPARAVRDCLSALSARRGG